MYKYYEEVTNHKKKIKHFNYKHLKNPTDVSHSNLRSCQYETWSLMKIWMCDVFPPQSVQNKYDSK